MLLNGAEFPNFTIHNRRALQSIENVTIQREQVVCQKAKDTAAGAGESDLRRLKRQFTSLKNTYMLYDTKEHFLDGVPCLACPLHLIAVLGLI